MHLGTFGKPNVGTDFTSHRLKMAAFGKTIGDENSERAGVRKTIHIAADEIQGTVGDRGWDRRQSVCGFDDLTGGRSVDDPKVEEAFAIKGPCGGHLLFLMKAQEIKDIKLDIGADLHEQRGVHAGLGPVFESIESSQAGISGHAKLDGTGE